jgi:hypothetical protein
VVDRLRNLADHPLDRRVARAVLILGLAATVGVGLLVCLAAVEGGDGPGAGRTGAASSRARSRIPSPAAIRPKAQPRWPEQDPQDRLGSAARRRAIAELRSHRALQHVPYRHGGVSIALAGAQGPRAVLRVTAPTTLAARAGWRAFLRRFHDHGSAYLPRFRGGRERRGGGEA